ncbi:fructosamine kinase family protein [Haloarchaeobius sp. HME9146]|uniref:fructosamine kinase family protein n=1 Tax=Haloarchaeobius sp. HME9146 TaxID=2978732 RepID=UPI0021C01EFF|nr:fructosamine kinase family protein [Haloarchaeobius sp. HME9146]MCT9097629.1 fructosamine kinase family protein [Haloarchaeobius sp. HME9146]
MDESTTTAVADWAGCPVQTVTELDGGLVGTVYRVDLADDRRVVVKTARTDLRTEAKMLAHLRSEGGLRVPEVYHVTPDLLVLEFVMGDSTITPTVERDLADRLAALHGTQRDQFGFPFDTLTGKYRQPNPWTADWATFFGDERLRHATRRAREEDVLPADLGERLTSLAADLPGLLDHDPTQSLIHGDVWSANLLTDGESVRAFLDPACYYADPEVELAYAEWTEVAGDAFFERYREVAGVDSGYDERKHVYRLYPLLTHVRHFGEEYLDPLEATLETLGY